MKPIAGVLLIVSLILNSVPAEANSVRVMSYNIRHGRGMDGEVDLERIAAVIKAEAPDVVCLQEVDRFMERTDGVDQPSELAKLLNMQAVFEPNLRRNGGEYGNATLTRLEIVDYANNPLPRPNDREPRGALRTTLRKNGVTFDVFNTHLGLDAEERKAQAAALLRLVTDRPTIIAGDINEEADGPAARLFHPAFNDAWHWRSNGAPATYPAGDAPERRIDYVFASKDLNVLSFHVPWSSEARIASDHLPCLAVAGLPEPPKSAAGRGIHGVNDERVDDAAGERP